MNALPLHAGLRPTLAEIAFAWLAPTPPGSPADATQGLEAAWLGDHAARVAAGAEQMAALLAQWRATPPPADARLAALADTLQLSGTEAVAVALACAAETDSMAARVLAWLQAPVGGSRPTVGLVVQVAQALGEAAPVALLAAGRARACGLLRLDDEQRVLAEAAISVPQPIVLALCEPGSLHWRGLRLGLDHPVPLPASLQEAARAHARAAGPGGVRALVVRSGHPREAQAAAAAIAAHLQARVVFIDGEVPAGLGPWLWLAAAIPVLCLELAPGERRRIPPIPGWRGPVLLATGPDGGVEFDGETVPGWRVPVPSSGERAALWEAVLGRGDMAAALGAQHRHAAGRIAELGHAARFEAQLDGQAQVTREHVARAARGGAAGDLGAMAEPVHDEISDAALVLPAAVRAELDALVCRCLARDALADGLGPAVQARLRHGVRALFVGPSGTGKSLAVGWLATRLGLPLYRVDLASVTSKYIGETEKNLAQLFARAEHCEVVLMFDEADSLFGKRTDVKDSNDRFANAQTNYLLSRIESYEGIAILTSNSRARFDSAFTRRLDSIVEFPMPAPGERRALWLGHLGTTHALSAGEVNRIAASCDIAGGHVRNAVLAAAASARQAAGPIGYEGLRVAIATEYRKLGKQAPG
jgi:hypothetical protein